MGATIDHDVAFDRLLKVKNSEGLWLGGKIGGCMANW